MWGNDRCGLLNYLHRYAKRNLILVLSVLLLATTSLASPGSHFYFLQNHARSLLEINSHEEWHEALWENKLEDFFSQTPDTTPETLCQDLRRLNMNELTALYQWVSHSNQIGPCQENLIRQVNIHFQMERLATTSRIQSQELPELRTCDPELVRQNILGPSKEVLLDVSHGRTVVDAGLPHCHINLSFDDGPHSRLTRQLLSILESEQVRANFFVVGRNVNRFPDIVQETFEKGHIVGNHSYSHPNLQKLVHNDALDEINHGFMAISNALGFIKPFFRFPFGASTPNLKSSLYEDQVLDFFWNMDSLDWRYKDVEELYIRTITQIERRQRGIILFHDIQPQTIAVMPLVLSALKKAGYTTAVLLPDGP